MFNLFNLFINNQQSNEDCRMGKRQDNMNGYLSIRRGRKNYKISISDLRRVIQLGFKPRPVIPGYSEFQDFNNETSENTDTISNKIHKN